MCAVRRKPGKTHGISAAEALRIDRKYVLLIVLRKRMVGLVHTNCSQIMIYSTDHRNVCVSHNSIGAPAASTKENAGDLFGLDLCSVNGTSVLSLVYFVAKWKVEGFAISLELLSFYHTVSVKSIIFFVANGKIKSTEYKVRRYSHVPTRTKRSTWYLTKVYHFRQLPIRFSKD